MIFKRLVHVQNQQYNTETLNQHYKRLYNKNNNIFTSHICSVFCFIHYVMVMLMLSGYMSIMFWRIQDRDQSLPLIPRILWSPCVIMITVYMLVIRKGTQPFINEAWVRAKCQFCACIEDDNDGDDNDDDVSLIIKCFCDSFLRYVM